MVSNLVVKCRKMSSATSYWSDSYVRRERRLGAVMCLVARLSLRRLKTGFYISPGNSSFLPGAALTPKQHHFLDLGSASLV